MLLLAQIAQDTPAALGTNFSTLDWIIVAVYLVLPVGIGVLAYKYIHSVKGFVVGGGAAGTALNIATYTSTGLGLVTLMYAAVDGLQHGFAYLTLALIAFVAVVIVGWTGFVIVPLRRMGVLTVSEYFESRFNRRVRILGGMICVVAGVLNMGLFPKMGALFLTYVTGFGGEAEETETMINIIMSLLIVIALFYTVLGGMVSVIINDYLQFIVLSVAMGLGLYFCLTNPNLGWTKILDTLQTERGEMMFNPVADSIPVAPKSIPADRQSQLLADLSDDMRSKIQNDETGELKNLYHHSYGWTWLGFNMVVMIVAMFCWAPESSRALTARDPSVAQRTFFLSSPGQFARLGIPALWAMAALTLIAQSPQLKDFFFPTNELHGMQGPIHEPAAAMPLAMGMIVPTGLLGILVAGLLAAFLSTHDSYFLCWASVISRDVVSPMRKNRLTERQELVVIRVSVILIGVFLLAWGVWYQLPDSIWTYMSVSGTIYLSGCGVALAGGIYWKRASTVGAYASMIAGVFALAGLFLEPINAQIESAGYSWQLTGPGVGLGCYITCAISFIVFSLLFPDPPAEAG